MSSVQERLQLKRVPLDVWNIREQLCLASAVVRSGDQNWMSVSRALKTVGEPNRPSDWYSQKSCAAQYGALLEHVETPKRKKRCSEGAVETPQESILKRLTQERVVEIQKTVAEMTQQYEQLKSEVAEARNPSTSEERLREMWAGIEAAKRARERESARRAAMLKEREERRARVDRTWRPPSHTPPTTPVSSAAPSSPLLTSLLKSSPVVTTPQHISHPANSVDCVSPSAGAPTLSMLLEKPGGTPHEKAAIEHIKSQLVQIEHQLRANSTPPPAPAPPLDIDDIEIKAEDVYAFRDLDLSIPLLHKGGRPTDKPTPKKDDAQPTPPVTMPAGEQVKEEPMAVDAMDTTPQEIESVEVVAEEPTPAVAHEEEPPDETTENEPKVAFPEFKFPTTEIKVIQSDEEKIKEEVKEVEEPEPPKVDEEDEEVNVEDTSVTADEQISIETANITATPSHSEPPPEPPAAPEPEVTEEAPSSEPVQICPEDIPLPPSPVPEVEPELVAVVEDPPLPPEPEPEPVGEQPETEETTQKEAEDKTEKEPEVHNEDVVKEDDGEDSMPLKEIKQETEPQEELEVKEELVEMEETHTETDDDTPMEVSAHLLLGHSHDDQEELSREEEKDGRKRRDYSRKKKSDSRTCSGSESAAEASAPDSPSGNDAEREYRLWKRSVMLVYSRLCAHKYASLFLRPITDEEAPNYSVVVKRPMDLTTIRKNIDNGVIRTTSEFQRDVLLMLSNALMYNSSEHSVYRMAKEMHEEAGCQLGMLVAAQAHAGLCAPPPLRKRRRHHNTSA